MQKGNSRAYRVYKWLTKLPEEARYVALDLRQQDEETGKLEPVRVARMVLAEDAKEQAETLIEILQDAADEAGRVVRGSALGLDGDMHALATLNLQGRPNRDDNGPLPSAVEEMDGSTRSERQQDQRHREAMTRLRIAEVAELRAYSQSVVEQLMEQNQRLADRLAATEEREEDARALVRAIEDEVADATAKAGEGEEQPDQATALMMKVVAPVLMKRLMAHNPAPVQDEVPAVDEQPPAVEAEPEG